MKIFLTLFILIFSVNLNFGQTKKFRWTTLTCEFESDYDASKYSLKQLRDTAKLINFIGLPLEFDATPQTLDGIDNLDIAQLEAQYLAKKKEYEGLKLINKPVFENLRKKRLNELEQVYQLSKITATAYKIPQVLKNLEFADSCKTKYADSLITGGDALLKTWLEVNIVSRNNNADPARIKRIYEEQLNSADKFRYAQSEVMTFGWWNCANAFIDYAGGNSDDLEKEFKKIFKKTRRISCDEP